MFLIYQSVEYLSLVIYNVVKKIVSTITFDDKILRILMMCKEKKECETFFEYSEYQHSYHTH